MARIARIRGPASSFELTGSFVLVPGFTFTRSYGNGTLDISVTLASDNVTAGNTALALDVQIDGVTVAINAARQSLAPPLIGSVAFRTLEPILPGIHTIQVLALGDAAAGDTIRAGSMDLVVIELPQWDDESFIITL